MILKQIESLLDDDRFVQKDPEKVRMELKELLDVEPPLLFDYFCRFAGPIGSMTTSFMLLDVIKGNPNVASSTAIAREQFGLGRNMLVLSDFQAGSVVAYDAYTDKVYDLDFEGGVELLKQQRLEPLAESFEEFLHWFYAPEE